jgi:hypothetical protein
MDSAFKLTGSSDEVLIKAAHEPLKAAFISSMLKPSAFTTSAPTEASAFAASESGFRVIDRTENSLFFNSDRTTAPP